MSVAEWVWGVTPYLPTYGTSGFIYWRWYRERTREPFKRKTKRTARRLVGHAIRHELDELEEVIDQAGEKTYGRCIELFRLVAAYVLLNCLEGWPADQLMAKIARLAGESGIRLPVTEAEIHEYLSRVVFGFEPFEDVFPAEKARTVPLYTLAHLLVRFGVVEGWKWWRLFDRACYAIVIARGAKLSVRPALQLREHTEEHRRATAANAG